METTGLGEPRNVVSDRGKRVFYHGTGVDHAAVLMPEFGLLLKSETPATLTPYLEVFRGVISPQVSTLTFWYPKPDEIQKPSISTTKPVVPFTKELRDEALEKIQISDLDERIKDSVTGLIQQSTSFLPPSRLGAIATTNDSQVEALSRDLPQHDLKIFSEYASSREELVERVAKKLGDMKITYFDPGLNDRSLAEDMARTTIEHALLSLGLEVRQLKEADPSLLEWRRSYLQKRLDLLKSIEFEEASLDRYRRVLIASLEKITQ